VCVCNQGRIRSYRDVSAKLVFFDLVHDQRKIQCVANKNLIAGELDEFYARITALRIGDIVAVTGFPARSNNGELSVYATSHPRLLAPCLHQVPDALYNPEKLKQNRHLDLLVNPTAAATLKLRSRIISQIRAHLTALDYMEVQTPILSSDAGGALARPFLTEASSIHKTLALRIAPELWLKRLLVGGMDRVFELGQQFRNEGIDATHNPEFTTCEAYLSFGRLQDVMSLTVSLFRELLRLSEQLKKPGNPCEPLVPLDIDTVTAINTTWKKLSFIPALEEALGEALPDLEKRPEAEIVADLLAVAERHEVHIDRPEKATAAKVLDKLSERFLESQCEGPTWIMHHPACMSPLAKHRDHIGIGRRVAERVELFIDGVEYVNAYEEENSPWEQRRKFVLQRDSDARGGEGKEVVEAEAEAENRGKWHIGDPSIEGIDNAYCEALEWGLPPTAGWGLGVDRLVMLLSGQERIADVMAFGGLRGAVNQGAKKPAKEAPVSRVERKVGDTDIGIKELGEMVEDLVNNMEK
jgi:lysyl-tRNA synthetase class 2